MASGDLDIAGTLGLDSIKDTAIGAVDMAQMGLLIVMIIALLGALGYYFWMLAQFKHKLRIKIVVNNRFIVVDDKFKLIKDEDGTPWWKLLKNKEKIAIAPSEAIEIDNKGNMVVEAYRLETGEYVFAKDVAQPVPKDIMSIEDKEERKEAFKEWSKTKKAIVSYQPLTTKQRVILTSQIRKAQERKKKSWKEHILLIASAGIIVVVLALLLMFWGDIAKPFLDMGDKLNANAEIQTRQLEVLKEIKQDIQVVHAERPQSVAQPTLPAVPPD